MKKYQSIILATDLGELSEKIIKEAVSIAEQSDGELHIFHALEAFPTFSWGYADLKAFEEAHHEEAKKRLSNLTDTIGYNKTKTHLTKKHPKTAIVELAKEINADLIIVGRHAKDPLFGALGSTAASVVNNANCDVLVSHG